MSSDQQLNIISQDIKRNRKTWPTERKKMKWQKPALKKTQASYLTKTLKQLFLNTCKLLRDNTDKQLKEIRKIIYEQNENISEEVEIINETNRNSEIEKCNNWIEKNNQKCSVADLSRQKKESANFKIGYLKSSSLRSRKKKGWRKVNRA